MILATKAQLRETLLSNIYAVKNATVTKVPTKAGQVRRLTNESLPEVKAFVTSLAPILFATSELSQMHSTNL